MSYCTQQDIEARISTAQLRQLTNDTWSETSPTLSVAAHTGGSLTGTSYYVVTALNNRGETILSNEITYTVAGGNATARLSWTQVSLATSYKIYKSATSGSYISPCLLKQTTALTFDDDGTISTLLTGAPPTDASMPDPTIVTGILTKVDREIDSKAGQVYTVPFIVPTNCTSIPSLIKQIAIELAIYYCFSRRYSEVGVSQQWTDIYKADCQKLEDVSNLLVFLDGNPTLASAEANIVAPDVQVDFNNPDSNYSRY
jgi:phage gp36-like protein